MTSLPLLVVLFLLPGFWTLAKAEQDAKIAVGSSVIASKTSSNAAWTSSSGKFAFGFYAVETKFSIGIWLVTNNNTVIWTYDRDGELFPEGTQLKLTDGGLQIPSHAGDRAVSSGLVNYGQNVGAAVMKDYGNFVILNVNSKIMWQTFDYPTDTIVAGQVLRRGMQLVSSVSATNHASGRFQMVMQEKDGNLVMYPVNTPENSGHAYWALNTDGKSVTAAIFTENGTFTPTTELNLTKNDTPGNYSITQFQANIIVIGRMEPDGGFSTFFANINKEAKIKDITQFQGGLSESLYGAGKCSIKGSCGSNSYCKLNAATGGSSTNLVQGGETACLCLPGYVYKDEGKPYMGCNRNFSVGQYAEITHSMTNLNNISWLDDSYNNTGYATEKECSEACLWDPNCYAALFNYNRCRKQRYPFLYATQNADDTTVALIKVSSGEPQLQPPPPPQEIIDLVPTNKVLIQSVAVASASIFAFSATFFFLYIIINRRSSYQIKCRNMEIGLAGGMAPRYFTYRKLVEATKNFTNLLGKGSYGSVFRGEVRLGDGKVMHIAVKRLEKISSEGEKVFRKEMRAAGRAHHRNLVRLLGFCHEGSKFLLIYELMSQGSLADLIFVPKAARPCWEKRAGMAMDVAKGILYLHEGCKPTIIHGDIKPDNVLVAEDGTAKVGDLGLAMLVVSGQSKAYPKPTGTPFYQAPEWIEMRDPATPNVDVYSYGILLLELITCRKYFQEKGVDGHYHLTGWVKKCLNESTLERLLPDEEVEVNKDELTKMVMVALWCVQKSPESRKSMKEVVRMLGGKKSIPFPPDDTL